MKYHFKVYIMALLITIFGSYQLDSIAQNESYLQKKLDISYTNKNLSDLLKEIGNKFGVNIALNDVPARKVSGSLKEVSIEEALSLVLCGTPFDFTKSNSGNITYIVYKTNKQSSCKIDTKQYVLPITNIEASRIAETLPQELKDKVRIIEEQNAITLEANQNELNKLKEIILVLDKPLKQIELEVKVIELQKRASQSLRIFRESGFLIGQIRNGLSIFDFSLNTWNIFNRQLSYLERRGLARVHAYPKVVSISGREAAININDYNNLVLGSAFGFGQSIGVVQAQRLDTIRAGTNLKITPVLGNNELITAKIAIEVSENNGTTTQNGVTIPSVTTRREISSEIQVKDGQTVAIGGLVINRRNLDRQGLPIITSIPIIGDLLSNRNSQKNESELIVLITPRIRDLNRDAITLKNIPPSIVEPKYIESEKEKTSQKKKRRWFLFRWW